MNVDSHHLIGIFNNCPEVISEDEFHFLFEKAILVSDNLSPTDCLFVVGTLGEKFSKFCSPNVLTAAEQAFIVDILSRHVNFLELESVNDFISALFNFRVEVLYNLLLEKQELAYLPQQVRVEIAESIWEYKL